MKTPSILLIALALSWAGGGGRAQSLPPPRAAGTASEQLNQIHADLKRTHAANDAAGFLAAANRNVELLNGSPDSLLQLMSAQAFAGDTPAALATFTQFVRMGQSDEDTLNLPQFEKLRADPGFAAIHAQMAANTRPLSRATEAFSLTDPGLLPEDIDYDPATKLFYITSVLEDKILAVDTSGTARLFASAPDPWPMLAIKVDSRRHLLWATEVALDGFDTCPRQDWGRSAIVMYDLPTHKLLRRIEGPPKSGLADMALTNDGDAIVSDSAGAGVYRVGHETLTLERLDSGEFISPQTPAISPDGKTIYIPDYDRGIGILNLRNRHVTWIPINGSHALNGIDGVYLYGNTLIATQNGTSPERVTQFALDPALAQITSASVIERATPTLGDPTHGVIVDGNFYYIANSGWNTLDDHGRRKPGISPSPPLIMRAPLH
ncbi:MAG: hypothetical protein JOZ33_03720 [Acidobacteriaceae bacterium]|nr:hypothetical protein [Acidobacteriaceae bacterium]